MDATYVIGAGLVLYLLSRRPSLPPVEEVGLSYLGRSDLPRGMRNNNPGNIRIGGSAWRGKVPVAQNTDGAFEQFVGYLYGVRAMIKLLQNYFRDGYTTIRTIVNRWAPPTENDSISYALYVSRQTGFRVDAQLRPTRDVLRKLTKAMAQMENGRPAVTDQQFFQAYEML